MVALARNIVASGRHLVCYANTGGSDGMAAGRCIRLCNFFYEVYGVPTARLHRLEGGYDQWKKEGRPIDAIDVHAVPAPPSLRERPADDDEDDAASASADVAGATDVAGANANADVANESASADVAGASASADVAGASAAAAAAAASHAPPPLPLARFRVGDATVEPDGTFPVAEAAYVVAANRGAKARAAAALDSPVVAILPRFLRVAATVPPQCVRDGAAATVPPAAPARLYVAGPWGAGWVSTKTLRGPLQLEAAPAPELPPVLSPRGYSVGTSRGDAAATTWKFRGDESRASGTTASPTSSSRRRSRWRARSRRRSSSSTRSTASYERGRPTTRTTSWASKPSS